MAKVLILGATGSVGHALVTSLVRSGDYSVYGLARTPEKARSLAALEVTPVPGSATDSAAYIKLIHDAHIDVVVDVSGAGQESRQVLSDVRAAGKTRLERATALGVPYGGPKLAFVYTSGSWVHGTIEPGRDVNDLDAVGAGTVGKVASLVQYRPEFEKEVLKSNNVLDVAIVRPGMIYGGNSWIFNTFFEAMELAVKARADGREEPTVQLPVDPHGCWSLVHVEDTAAGIHRVLEKVSALGSSGAWPVFDLVNSVENKGALLNAAARAMGLNRKPEFVIKEGDVMAEALSTSQALTSGRARSILGWVPKKTGMLGQIEVYVNAWKAARA